MFGDYYTKTRAQILMTKHDGVPNGVAALVGRRLVSVSEISEGQQIAEGLLKDLVGQDTVSARFLFKEFFNFVPTHKIWMYGNHKPIIRGTDTGIWRKVKLIPFEVTIPDAEKDRELGAKLLAEGPGILNWLIQGCLRWQEGGLQEPEAVTLAVNDYRTEMDQVAQFVDACCEIKPSIRTAARTIYLAYRTWCLATGESPLSQNKLGKHLRERGYEQMKSSQMTWIDLTLRDEGKADQ